MNVSFALCHSLDFLNAHCSQLPATEPHFPVSWFLLSTETEIATHDLEFCSSCFCLKLPILIPLLHFGNQNCDSLFAHQLLFFQHTFFLLHTDVWIFQAEGALTLKSFISPKSCWSLDWFLTELFLFWSVTVINYLQPEKGVIHCVTI